MEDIHPHMLAMVTMIAMAAIYIAIVTIGTLRQRNDRRQPKFELPEEKPAWESKTTYPPAFAKYGEFIIDSDEIVSVQVRPDCDAKAGSGWYGKVACVKLLGSEIFLDREAAIKLLTDLKVKCSPGHACDVQDLISELGQKPE